ncbi:MAG: Cof-type HAD-IIB family hydrolase [Clostridia bacterium]|nr:Cof-type HAD-IIB family hydrolase [Clostridia bacterium]
MAGIRMMAFDLDGTLLGLDRHISPRNVRALQEAHRRGIKLVLASGRGFLATRRFAAEAGVPAILATSNGARIDESPMGPLICERCFDEYSAKAVMRLMSDAGMFFVAYCDNANYQANIDARLPDESDYYRAGVFREDGFTFEMVEDEGRMWNEGWRHTYKFVTFTRPNDPRLDALREKLAPLNLAVEASWCNNVEVMMPSAGKGNALAFLAERYGIDREEVMAFGDNFNDESMLRYAGWPVVMENGEPELKKIARIVAPHHAEDGVGRVIEEYVLKD